MQRPPFVLRVEQFSGFPGAGVLVFVNGGESPVRVWRFGNTWGDVSVSFELTQGKATTAIHRRLTTYTRNVPSTVEIRPGGSHRVAFDLGDGTWESRQPIDHFRGANVSLVAVYDAGNTPEARTVGVWPGHVRSEPVARR